MYLYGASGHGKVIKEILEARGETVEAFIDDNPHADTLAGIPVRRSADGCAPLIISIGANVVRRRIVERLGEGCTFGVAIHPSAIVSPTAKIGEGTVVMAGAVINAEAIIGRHCIINTGATIDHECVIGDYVHIAPQVALCGQVHVGDGTLIGVGACAIPCVQIGQWCTIGAGAAVVHSIADHQTAVGVPAKPLSR